MEVSHTQTLSQIRGAIQSTMKGRPGAFVLVDGQYGSTGKGLAASVLAEAASDQFDLVTSNAGPNSGHTSYPKGEKVVLQQLSSFAVAAKEYRQEIESVLNAGAIVDAHRLLEEIRVHRMKKFTVDPMAALVQPSSKRDEEEMVSRIGSTGKGTGAAQARKIMRDPNAVVGPHRHTFGLPVGRVKTVNNKSVFVEVSQGFSLSLNASGFYPYCTSRDCTVAQAMSDAGLHPSSFRGAMMVCRTFPIRVAGNSGPCYGDQTETTWEGLGVPPEKTTVTNKVRRVFTWSEEQFMDAVRVNRPNMLFFNFMNYLITSNKRWVENALAAYRVVMNKDPDLVLLGYGPRNEDVRVYNG